MGRRSILRAFNALKLADSTTNPISEITDVSGLDNITYLVKVDPSVVGEMFVEFSLEEKLDPGTFDVLSFGEQLIVNGPSETVYSIKVENHGFKWLRLRFADNAGAGQIVAYVSGNTVGA